jgi:Flp pilus assembly protein CpaB
VLATVVVALLVAAFLLVAGVAGWVVRRLWSATGDDGEPGPETAPAVPVAAQPSTQED